MARLTDFHRQQPSHALSEPSRAASCRALTVNTLEQSLLVASDPRRRKGLPPAPPPTLPTIKIKPYVSKDYPPPFPGQARPSPNRILAIPVADRGKGLHCEV
jgi:hypothetical protein